MDVGATATRDFDLKCNGLESSERTELNRLCKVIGKTSVLGRNLESAPHWLFNKAVICEIEDAWKDAFVEIDECLVPANANVISSNIIYKIKIDEKCLKKLKTRLCPHGNRDREKDQIRSDLSNVQFDIIRLILVPATDLRFRLGCIDFKAAYLQSGPITRELFVTPPNEYDKRRRKLWKPIKLPYEVSEAGRQ